MCPLWSDVYPKGSWFIHIDNCAHNMRVSRRLARHIFNHTAQRPYIQLSHSLAILVMPDHWATVTEINLHYLHVASPGTIRVGERNEGVPAYAAFDPSPSPPCLLFVNIAFLPPVTMNHEPLHFHVPDVRFRVLIVGRANAGKMSILQRVCKTTESPKIYRVSGGACEEVRPSCLVLTISDLVL